MRSDRILAAGRLVKEGGLLDLCGSETAYRARFATGHDPAALAELGFRSTDVEGAYRVEAADPSALNDRLDAARKRGALLVELARDLPRPGGRPHRGPAIEGERVKAIWTVAVDLLREAASRKWFLALGIGITTALVVLGFALRLEVVDGALAATKLFGKTVNSDIRSVDVALRYVYRAAA